jgi:hypothetical protein
MRKSCLTALLLLLAASTAAGATAPATAAAPAAGLPVKLGPVAKIQLPPTPPLSTAQRQHIKDLIDSFTQLDQPDIGLSATLSGTSFAPLHQATLDTMALPDPRHQPSPAMIQLVTLGPDALPLLLASLDDQRPTRLLITHEGPIGMMWFGGERDRNPLNPAETPTRPAQAADPLHEPPLTSYTVKVGDVCFVAIGQIVGRAYEAVRYQPTANIVINSPTTNAQLCAAVRAAWASDNPRQKLLDSLLTDYATQGIFNGASLDGWSQGSARQCTAARLLLFYFPTQTAPLIASRLATLDVKKPSLTMDDTIRRWVAQGVRPDDFIAAVAWCPAPAIRDAITAIFKRSGDLDCTLAALPAIHDDTLIRQRLAAFIDALPLRDIGPHGDAYKLLTRVIPIAPAIARELSERYLKNDTVARRYTLCEALRSSPAPWAPELLWPMLSDTRATGDTYTAGPSQTDPLVSLRLCDAAAEALAANDPGLHFQLEGTHDNLDRQIDTIKTTLAGSPATRPN